MTVYGIGLAFGDPALGTYLAVLDFEHNERRCPTYDDLMQVTRCSRAGLHGRIARLRALGLVEWAAGCTGTLRAVQL